MGKQASVVVNTKRESVWRDRIARHSVSKQSVEAFCRSEGVSTAGFYGWRARLRALDVDAALSQRKSSPSFIDLGPVNSPGAGAATSHGNAAPDCAPANIEVRVDLGCGVVLTIARH